MQAIPKIAIQATKPDLKTTPLGTLATDTLQKINMKAPKASITI